jgi:flagellin-like hook-associated protein FlgL
MSKPESAIFSQTQTTAEELKKTAKRLGKTSERLVAGIGSEPLESAIDTNVGTVDAIRGADECMTKIAANLRRMQTLIGDAQDTADGEQRRALGEAFNGLIQQIETIAKTPEAGGVNLLCSLSAPATGVSPSASVNTQPSVENVADWELDADREEGKAAANAVESKIVTNANEVTSEPDFAITYEGGEARYGIKSAGMGGASWEIDWGCDDYQEILGDLSSQLGAMQDAFSTEADSLHERLSVITSREEFSIETGRLADAGHKSPAAIAEDVTAHKTSVETSRELENEKVALASKKADGELKKHITA